MVCFQAYFKSVKLTVKVNHQTDQYLKKKKNTRDHSFLSLKCQLAAWSPGLGTDTIDSIAVNEFTLQCPSFIKQILIFLFQLCYH